MVGAKEPHLRVIEQPIERVDIVSRGGERSQRVEHGPQFGHVEIHSGEEVEVARHSMVQVRR